MFEMKHWLWLILALPLTASVLTAALGPRVLRRHSHVPCIAATLLALVLSALVLVEVAQGQGTVESYYEWFKVSRLEPGFNLVVERVDIGFTLRADGLTAITLVTVTFIGSLIAIYSVGYMHGDPGYARFFAEIALFIFSMTGLVLASNFIVLYAFWEGVGLCSYLLIGFWFGKPSAAAAARKAFLVTRIGDVSMILSILML